MQKTVFIFFIIIFFIFGSFAPKAVFGIGQVTKPIVIKDALRNQDVTATLSFSSSEEEEVFYGLKAEGEIADWASFYQPDDKNFENPITKIKVFPKSFQKAEVKFIIPNDIPNGEYFGKVYIFTMPAKDEKEDEITMAVSQRIGRKVSITVTDEEIVKFDTAIIPLKYQVNKNEPLEIKIIHTNQGNVLIEPNIQLKITKDDQAVFNAIFPYPDDENPVKPRERKVLSSLIEWQTTGQGHGYYKIEASVLLKQEIINQTVFGLTIGNTDKIKVLGWFGLFGTPAGLTNPFLLKIIMIAIVIIIIASIFIKNKFLKNKLAKIIAIKK